MTVNQSVNGGASGICGATFNVLLRTISVGSALKDVGFETPLRSIGSFGYAVSFGGSCDQRTRTRTVCVYRASELPHDVRIAVLIFGLLWLEQLLWVQWCGDDDERFCELPVDRSSERSGLRARFVDEY